jgi:hypothetical protein
MNAQVFDINQVLSETQDAGFETKFTQVDPGEWPAVIDKVAGRSFPKKDDPSQESHIVDITYAIDDAGQRAKTGLEKPTVRQSIFLDLVDGKLDKSKNKNITLGRLLMALGFQDENGQSLRQWSFNDLVGRAVVVKVEQSPNPKSPKDPFVNVTSVGKMG